MRLDGQALTSAESADLPAGKPSAMLPQERAAHAAKEAEVGITDYVSSGALGFQGLLKKRYTDFIVNEILPSGEVVHLQKLGKAAKSDTEKVSKKAVSSEQNGTGVQIYGTSESTDTASRPLATLEIPGPDEGTSKQLQDGELKEDESRVCARFPELMWKLIHGLGFS
jgi:tRNA pseudouridine13 synthase